MSRQHKIPPKPRHATCTGWRCDKPATTYNELPALILRPDGIYQDVEWVCPRHKDRKDSE